MLIGITGRIGSGKSAVARLAAASGFDVLDADALAHQLYRESTDVRQELVDAFGADVLTEEGVNRAKLAEAVFSDPSALAHLERIVHPVLLQTLKKRMEDVQSRRRTLFIEAALFPRWPKFVAQLDQLWWVSASEEIRLERLISRGLLREDALRRIALQGKLVPPSHPHFCEIPNNGSRECLLREVMQLLRGIAVVS
ncbi:MAG TPA: dephospho-CoA kinase [Fibrobacteraceae bacterium]|nr:dephospho-CoA kinase [Fibrobacteraceae bacterium]